MTDTTKIQLTNVFDNLNLLPKITNLEIARRDDKSTILTTLQIDTSNNNSPSWINDQNITKLLNITISYSLTEQTTEFLLKNTDILFGLNNKLSSKEIIQVTKPLNSSFINTTKVTDFLNIEHISTITDKIILDTVDIKHFTVFIAIYLNNEQLSNKFNIKITRLNKIIGSANYITYINNSQYVNSNINDLSVFKNINSLNITTNIYNKIVDEFNNNLLINKKNNVEYFSELYSSFNKKHQYTGIFNVDIKKIFKNESRYSGLFNNSAFTDDFFSTSLNYYPESIKITRKDKLNNEVVILNEKYNHIIDTNNCKLSQILLDDNKEIMWLSFLDKNSTSLNNEYTYSASIVFRDYTVTYINDLTTNVSNVCKQMQEVVNIAHNGNYYDLAVGRLLSSFFVDLQKHNLNLSNIILNTADIVSKFKEFSIGDINAIKLLANSNNINFNILENILNTLEFIKTQLSIIQNLTYSKEAYHINVYKEYTYYIDFNTNNATNLSIIDSNYTEHAYSYITIEKYLDRIKNEISKYYTLQDINATNKYSYLTPNKIYGKYTEINQEAISVSNIDFSLYNRLLLDLYVDNIYEGEFSKLSINEKLLMILHNFNIYQKSLSDPSINLIDHNINKNTKITNLLPDSKNNESLDTLLLDIFISCIFVQDTNTIDYSFVSPSSKQSKISLLTENNTPFQIYSVYQLLNNNKFVNLNKDQFLTNITNFINAFAYYMNLKCIYNVEYLDTVTKKWNSITIDILNNLGTNNLLCRYSPYKNENLQLNSMNLKFSSVDEYFIIRGNNVKLNINTTTNNIFQNITNQAVTNIASPTTNIAQVPLKQIAVPTSIEAPTPIKPVASTVVSKTIPVGVAPSAVLTNTIKQQTSVITSSVAVTRGSTVSKILPSSGKAKITTPIISVLTGSSIIKR